MEDVLEATLRFLVRVFRYVVEGVIEWFWESGMKKLPSRPSKFVPWWREESAMSKMHSITALITFSVTMMLLVVTLAAFWGIDPFGLRAS